MEEKYYKKTLYFYNLITKKMELLEHDRSGIVYSNEYFLRKTFPDIKSYQTDKNKIIDIIEFTNDYLFGSIGKLVENEIGILKRQRDINTLEKSGLPSFPPNKRIEDYTYFYISYNFSKLVVMKNTNAPQLNGCLNSFMESQCVELDYAMIVQDKISDMPKKLNSIQSLLNISFATKADDFQCGIPSIKELHLLSSNGIEKVSVSVDINRQAPDKVFINALSESQYDNLLNFKITGISEDDEDLVETIDMIKNVITKKVPVSFDTATLKNEDLIRKMLSKQLLANVNGNLK